MLGLLSTETLFYAETCQRYVLPLNAGVAAQVTAWLDEEWTPLEVHAALGRATGDAYYRLRAGAGAGAGSGDQRSGGSGRDITDILLGLSTELMAFQFRETFTGPFEVNNVTCG